MAKFNKSEKAKVIVAARKPKLKMMQVYKILTIINTLAVIYMLLRK